MACAKKSAARRLRREMSQQTFPRAYWNLRAIVGLVLSTRHDRPWSLYESINPTVANCVISRIYSLSMTAPRCDAVARSNPPRSSPATAVIPHYCRVQGRNHLHIMSRTRHCSAGLQNRVR